MLSQPQARTLVNSCEYVYLITSCEQFNQNLEHSWGYGISLRSRDLSKILADGTHVLTCVIGKCVAIDVYLSSQSTSNSTQYSLFYNCFFSQMEKMDLFQLKIHFWAHNSFPLCAESLLVTFHVTTSVILDQKILFTFYPKNPSQRWLFSFECALWRSLLVHQTQHN